MAESKSVFDPIEFQEAVKERNLKFKLMSPARRRVTVARDVLHQIEIRKIVPSQGAYLQIEGLSASSSRARAIGDETVECHACAIGAVFLASLSWTSPEHFTYGSRGMRATLEQHEVFFPQMLRDMETVFEGAGGFGGSTGSLQLANELNDRHYGPERRLRLMMENIIRNDGEFDIAEQFERFQAGIEDGKAHGAI